MSSSSTPLPSWKEVLRGVHPKCRQVVECLGFGRPTAVQAHTIPHFCNFKDVMVEACTGSGKTLAFLIPVLHILLRTSRTRSLKLKSKEVYALIIAPTRELSQQIATVTRQLIDQEAVVARVSCALVTGGIRSHEDGRYISYVYVYTCCVHASSRVYSIYQLIYIYI